MSSDTGWGGMLSGPVRRFPADLAATVLLAGVAVCVVALPVVGGTAVGVAVAVPFLLFAPGYVVTAALFPRAAPEGDENARSGAGGLVARVGTGVGWVERVALSVGLSVATVPLVGLALNFTPLGIRPVPIAVSVAVLTALIAVYAADRRRDVPVDERPTVPYHRWAGSVRSAVFDPETRRDAALNVLVAVSVLAAVSGAGYAVTAPTPGEPFTEFYVLTESQDGDLVADDYPNELTAGQASSFVLGVGNHEHRPMRYSVIVAIQRVEVADGSTTVTRQRRLATFRPTLEPNTTWTRTHDIAPGMTGTDLRIVFLLYPGDPPANPSVDSAYRELHLWVDVSTSPDSGAAESGDSVNETDASG